jgi:hypothetical protein
LVIATEVDQSFYQTLRMRGAAVRRVLDETLAYTIVSIVLVLLY